MSDYFGALLRSSGLVGGRIAAAEPALREIGVDAAVSTAPPAAARAAEASTAVSTGAAAPPPLRSLVARSAIEPDAAATHPPPAGTSPLLQSAPHVATERPSTSGPRAVTPAEARLAPAHAAAALNGAVPPISRVQAALRWVAADPQAHAYAAGWSGFPAPRVDAAATAPAADETAPAGQSRSAATDRASAVVDRAEASPPRRTLPAGDVPIEVSIGAIELRVEAPAPAQTVVRPAPSAPAAAAPPRSALARRALRRI